jgi:hypothetical protein
LPLLAEALDVVFTHQGQTPGSALQLGITTSQLVKFLKQEPRAFLLVNEWRRQHGLRTLE